ncbi:UNKNOWN [Stylonychia lemnae]|uniref:EF-hand domain-containing protein n=1 Tax=Stylonychia lemnae TaxID=5949 RepID=A0A078B7V0_STYLE|nr:UNKNOWN [Stylonychia lemnae]|eukprot:CDW89633.1 UNKNOWN [Stylonychia lemnae]
MANSSNQQESSNQLRDLLGQFGLKKIEQYQTNEVTNFIDKLKHNQAGLNTFIRELNKSQQMALGKQAAAISISSHHRTFNDAKYSSKSKQSRNMTAASKIRPQTNGVTGTSAQSETMNSSFFGQRLQRLKTAATTQDHRLRKYGKSNNNDQLLNNTTVDLNLTQKLDMNPLSEQFSGLHGGKNRSMVMGHSAGNQSYRSDNLIQGSGGANGTYSQYYYFKFIHPENRKLIQTQQKKREKFIPETDTEKSSFKQRFKLYMDQVNQEEEDTYESELKEKKQKLADKMMRTEVKLNMYRTFHEGIIDTDEYEQKVKNHHSIYETMTQVTEKDRDKEKYKNSLIKINLIRSETQDGRNSQQKLIKIDTSTQSHKISRNESPQNQKSQKSKHQDIIEINNLDQTIKHKASLLRVNQSFFQRLQANEQLVHKQSFRQKNSKQLDLNPQLKQNKDHHIQIIKNQHLAVMAEEIQSATKTKSKKPLSHSLYVENIKKLKDLIKGEHFKTLCQQENNSSIQFRNCRLTKIRLKQYIAQRYGNSIADKLIMIMDFTNPIDYASFLQQLEQFLKNKDLLRLVAFDIYDFNNDGKISDIDLFKIFSFFSKGQNQLIFEQAFQTDLCAISKLVQAKKLLKENGGVLDPRETVHSSPVLVKKYQQKQRNSEDIQLRIKKVTQQTSEIGINMFNQRRVIEDNSDDDDGKTEKDEQDFFGPSNHFYRHMKAISKQKNKNGPSEAQIEEYKKQLNAQNNAQKVSRSSSLAKNTLSIYQQQKLMKQMHQQNNSSHNTSISDTVQAKKDLQNQNYQTLLQNPLWDDFFNSYMENTQVKINIGIKLEDFQRLTFGPETNDMPNFIIDFVDYLIGLPGTFRRVLNHSMNLKTVQNDHSMSSQKSPYLGSQEDMFLSSSQNLQSGNLLNNSQNMNSHLQYREFQNRLSQIKQQLNQNQQKALITAFLILSGNKPEEEPQTRKSTKKQKIEDLSEKYNLMEYILTEQSIMDNFEVLFGGHQIDILAKLIYLYLAKCKECIKIGFLRFADAFMPILNELTEKRNEFIFKLLDVGSQGKINVLHLIQYFKHIQTNSAFGQEIYKQQNEANQIQGVCGVQGKKHFDEVWVQSVDYLEFFHIQQNNQALLFGQ